MEKDDNFHTDVIEETDLVLKAIKKCKIHSNILRMKSFFIDPKVFSFNILMLRTRKGKSII